MAQSSLESLTCCTSAVELVFGSMYSLYKSPTYQVGEFRKPCTYFYTSLGGESRKYVHNTHTRQLPYPLL